MKPTAVLVLAGLIVALGQNVEAQSQQPPKKLRILTPEGEVALRAKLFIGVGETMSLVGTGDEVHPLGQSDGGTKLGQPTKKNSRPTVFVATEQGEGIDLSGLLQPNFGGMSGFGAEDYDEDMEDMMGGMGAIRATSAFYYVVDPQHGFAFVPKQRQIPKVIRLRPAAKLEVSVPKRYSPEQYVVLACWMNRYADPITYQPLSFNGGGGMDMEMDMGGLGGMEAGYGGSFGPMSVSDPMHSRFSDWRLRTMVTHWTISEIQPKDAEEHANVATVVMPPGEVRITLVPKALARKQIGNGRELERLLFFGGPSQIKLTSESIPNSYQGTILPAGAVRDIEFVGRASGSGIPDWTQEENGVLLTTPFLDSLTPTAASSDPAVIQIAEQQRNMRSKVFLGRIAHNVGKERYIAIGVPNERFFAWSVNSNDIPAVLAAVKMSDHRYLTRSLEPLSVRSVSPEEMELREGIDKRSQRHDRNDLKLTSANSNQRLVYAISPLSSPRGRMLIDLTKRIKFQARNPEDDPFTAEDPNQHVGVISQTELERMRHPMFGMVQTGSDQMPMETDQAGNQVESQAMPVIDSDKLKAIQNRIDKLERDLVRAKKMLETLQN